MSDTRPTTITDKTLAQDAAQLSREFAELIRLVQFRDRDRACCWGLTVSQCYGLKAVCETGPLSVNDLAGALYLEKSTASRLARGLEDAGLVERSTDEEDRRSVRLAATEAGRRAHAGIEADLRAEYAALLADFPWPRPTSRRARPFSTSGPGGASTAFSPPRRWAPPAR